MRRIEERRLEMLRQVCRFGETHREKFPADGVGRQAFDAIAAAVDRMEKLNLEILLATRAVGMKAHLRAELVRSLEALERTGRLLDGGSRTANAFRLPPQRSDRMILMAGRTFVQEATKCEEQLVSFGMPAGCVSDLASRVDRMEAAVHDLERARAQRSEVKKALTDTLSSAYAALARLDVVVANTCRGDELTLGAWERARHVGYKPRKRRARRAAVTSPGKATLLLPEKVLE